MSRIHSRRDNGQFRRATLSNTFGLDAPVCPVCGSFNPYRIGMEPRPSRCHACDESLTDVPTDEDDEDGDE